LLPQRLLPPLVRKLSTTGETVQTSWSGKTVPTNCAGAIRPGRLQRHSQAVMVPLLRLSLLLQLLQLLLHVHLHLHLHPLLLLHAWFHQLQRLSLLLLRLLSPPK
jgi:hypothetical protein